MSRWVVMTERDGQDAETTRGAVGWQLDNFLLVN